MKFYLTIILLCLFSAACIPVQAQRTTVTDHLKAKAKITLGSDARTAWAQFFQQSATPGGVLHENDLWWNLSGPAFYVFDGSAWVQVSTGSGGGSGVTDGDKGDITVSNGGTVWTIDAGVVTPSMLSFVALQTTTNFGGDVSGTYNSLSLTANSVGSTELQNDAVTQAKLASGTPNRLQGFDAAGDPSEISAGANVTISAGVISSSGGGSTMVDTVQNVGDISNYTGSSGTLIVQDERRGGVFIISSQNVTDDNGVWMKDSNSRQFRRIVNGAISPLWFGATGDGVTDDLPALQNAVDAAGTNGLPNHVYLPNGDFLIEDDVLKLKSGMLFNGVGKLIINTSHNGANVAQENGIIGAYGTVGSRISNVTIRDISIRGAESVGGNMNGIMMAFCDSCIVENCTVDKSRNYGIWFKESFGGSILNNKVIGGTESIEVSQSSKNVNIRGNFVKGLGGKTINCVLIYGDAVGVNISENHIDGTEGCHGIFISASTNGCRDILLRDNHVSVQNDGAAIKWPVVFEKNNLDTLENFAVMGGFLKSHDACIRVNGSVNGVSVDGVAMESDSTEAIRFIPGAGMSRISITNCNIDSKDGVHLGDASNVVFSNNSISMTNANSFVGSNSANDVNYTSNRLDGGYLNIASNCLVDGNGVDGSGLAYSLYVQGDSNRVESNRIEKRLQVSGDYNSITSNSVNGDQIINDVGSNNLFHGNKSINIVDPNVSDLTGIVNPKILVQGDSDLYNVDATHFESAGGGFTKVSLTASVAQTGTTYLDVTGMGVALSANQDYYFTISLVYSPDVTTTGARFGWDYSGTGTVSGTTVIRQATGTASTAVTKNGSEKTYEPSNGATTSATTSNVIYHVFVSTTTAGTFIPRFAAETGGTITINQGKLIYQEI